jgi:hypothetical protein
MFPVKFVFVGQKEAELLKRGISSSLSISKNLPICYYWTGTPNHRNFRICDLRTGTPKKFADS